MLLLGILGILGGVYMVTYATTIYMIYCMGYLLSLLLLLPPLTHRAASQFSLSFKVPPILHHPPNNPHSLPSPASLIKR